MNTLTKKDLLLLTLLTLFWGLNWPIMKFTVATIPPIAFRVLGMSLSLPFIWIITRRLNESITVPKQYVWPLIKLAIPNVLVCQTLMILGVKMVTSGKAAILCYTMPAWIALLGVIFYREKLTKLTFFGILCALSGTLLLLANDFSSLTQGITGTLIVLTAAAVWGLGTLQLRHNPIPIPNTVLTFWMIAFSVVIMAGLSAIFENNVWKTPGAYEWFFIFYNALCVFCFSATVWNKMARTLPPIATGLSVMMVPVVGVFSGAYFLSETLRWNDYSAMILILLSMSSVLLKPKKDS